MSKLHTYYITNAKTELKFAYNDLNEEQFEAAMQGALFDAKNQGDEFYESDESNEADESDDEDDEDEPDESDESDDEDKSNESNDEDEPDESNSSNLSINEWVDFNDPKLAELFKMEVNVVIDVPPDHGSTEFSLEEVLDRTLVED